MPILAGKNLSYFYNKKTEYEVRAVEDVSFKINENSIVAIVGTGGSGKSTLIQLFNGILIPDQGQVDIDNTFVIKKARKIKNIKEIRKNIGIAFQFPESQLFCETVEKDIIFGPLNFGMKKDVALNKAKYYLELVGLSDEYLKKSPFSLSGGQKRRVAIAGILSFDPKILIFDEPTAGLDPEGKAYFQDLFLKLVLNEKKTIIFISHDMDEVYQIANYVYVMKNGKISYEGEPFDLFNNDELLKENNLTLPYVFRAIKLLKKYHPINELKTIKTVDQLAKFIVSKKVINE
ncbi:energy-coupling factor transporter ATPase [symbiont of Argiope bruennichi]|uniref:energy-coupling factor transporter ATPase n=1 Tax=symbiont of Argiope bruennichi TaxID=2810479 RepID=UPI003DA5489A